MGPDEDKIHPLLKDIKIEHFQIDAKNIPEFSESDFRAAMESMEHNLYMDMVNEISSIEINILNMSILDAFKTYLNCKSGEDVYNILTNPTMFFRINPYIEYINARIKYLLDVAFGAGVTTPFELREFKEPIPKSEETLEKFKITWEEVYECK